METIEAVGKSQSVEELLQVKILIVYLKCSNKWLQLYLKLYLKREEKHMLLPLRVRDCVRLAGMHSQKNCTMQNLWGREC